jgi:hypothetical protein
MPTDPVIISVTLPFSNALIMLLMFLALYTLVRLVLVIWSRLIP